MRLLCSVHKRDNIRMKMREMGVLEQPAKDIINSIFGYQDGDTFFTGLVDAEDTHDFRAKLGRSEI